MQEKQLQLVTYEQAKKLKSIGFDWKGTAFYADKGKDYGYALYDSKPIAPEKWLYPAPQ